MRATTPRLGILLGILLLASSARGAHWDYDTEQMQRMIEPGELEIMVGKFFRHSDQFYEWRISNRTKKIAAHDAGEAPLSDDQLASAYNDWAVALNSLGRPQEAIEVMREKAEKLPDVDSFKTLANLATFLNDAGQSAAAAQTLEQALAINPDPPLGREPVELLLIQYQDQAEDDPTSPIDPSDRSEDPQGGPFAVWLLKVKNLTDASPETQLAEIEQTIEALLAIMRFGEFESPVLLEALGDLQMARGQVPNGRDWAARSYLLAGRAVAASEAKTAYHRLAAAALGSLPLVPVEEQLAREIRETDDWFFSLADEERLWVGRKTPPDADELFYKKYAEQVVTLGRDRLPPARFTDRGLPWSIRAGMLGVGVFMVLLVVALLAWRRNRPRE